MLKENDYSMCVFSTSNIDDHDCMLPPFLQIGTYAGGGGLSACTGARGGNGGEQGQPAQGPCGSSRSGTAGTQTRGGEGGTVI